MKTTTVDDNRGERSGNQARWVTADWLELETTGLEPGSTYESLALTDEFGNVLSAADGAIDVRRFVRLSLAAVGDTEDHDVLVQYRLTEGDAWQDLAAATTAISTRTVLFDAENIEGVGYIRVRAKYSSSSGGSVEIYAICK